MMVLVAATLSLTAIAAPAMADNELTVNREVHIDDKTAARVDVTLLGSETTSGSFHFKIDGEWYICSPTSGGLLVCEKL